MNDRAALLIAAWGLDPQHEIVLFLSGSSERVPASPREESETLAEARAERDDALDARDDIQGQLEDAGRTLAEVLKIKRLPKTARALLEELLKEINDDATDEA